MRLFFYFLALLAAQGFLGSLLSPLAPPDFFLLAALTFLWRLESWQVLLLAYGVGLLQDIVGHGQLGIHALGLAGAVMAAILLREQLSSDGLLSRSLIILVALLGKWLTLTPLLIWLTGEPSAALGVLRVAPSEIILTLLVSFAVMPWANAIMDEMRKLRRELI